MDLESLNILIVDDMTYISSWLRDHFKLLGHLRPIQKAANVDEAIEIIKSSHKTVGQINFVITDINMPGKSGIDLVKILRVTPNYDKIPILAITGQDNSEAVLSAIDAGVNSYLLKPWTVEDLRKALNTCLK